MGQTLLHMGLRWTTEWVIDGSYVGVRGVTNGLYMSHKRATHRLHFWIHFSFSPTLWQPCHTSDTKLCPLLPLCDAHKLVFCPLGRWYNSLCLASVCWGGGGIRRGRGVHQHEKMAVNTFLQRHTKPLHPPGCPFFNYFRKFWRSSASRGRFLSRKRKICLSCQTADYLGEVLYMDLTVEQTILAKERLLPPRATCKSPFGKNKNACSSLITFIIQ